MLTHPVREDRHVRRTAPTRLFCLIRQHCFQLGLVCFVSNDALTQLPLAGARLRSQNVTGKSMMANHFAGAGLLEALRRTLVSLHLGHNLSWNIVSRRTPKENRTGRAGAA